MGRAPRGLDPTGCQRGLYVGGQDARPLLGQQPLAEDASERVCGRERFAGGKAQQCEARLRLAAVLAGLVVRVGGGVDLAVQSLELRQLVQRRAKRRLPGWIRQRCARPLRLVRRLRPAPIELEDLRSVHQAPAAEGNQLRLAVAPLRQRTGPLPRPRQVADVVARLDDAARDHACDQRRDLLRDNGDHGSIERGEPCTDLTEEQVALPDAQACHCLEVAIGALRRDRQHLVEGVTGAGRVAGVQRHQRLRDHHVATLGAPRVEALG